MEDFLVPIVSTNSGTILECINCNNLVDNRDYRVVNVLKPGCTHCSNYVKLQNKHIHYRTSELIKIDEERENR